MPKAIRLPPRSKDGKEARLFYITQTGGTPPRFLVFSNKAQKDLDISYPRYLVRRLRESFGFEGTPIRVTIRRRDSTKSNNRGWLGEGISYNTLGIRLNLQAF